MPSAQRGVPWYLDALACPDCQAPLAISAAAMACTGCPYSADRSARPLDLRPRRPVPLSTRLARKADPVPVLAGVDLTRPAPAFDGPRALRDSRELFSALLSVRAGGGDFLDLGCGPRDQVAAAEHCGFRYVGVDLSHHSADLLADAHALPFAARSFDVVFSYAVLEHLHNPFLALTEVHRVLRPGGHFVGTVSQGEPFHDSFFHHTPWGLASATSFAGLSIERLWPSMDTLRSLSQMGHYSRPVRWGLRALEAIDSHLPFLAPRRWLHWSRQQRLWDGCVRGGSLCFLIGRS